ncbi:MAG: hypothetical protein MZV65_19185 [Chromatiales bacterium]|nr:hypothetical protein [Chromatiales bacterium]
MRLHEANAGLIAISEILRACWTLRANGVPVIALIGGACGCFGGMSIVARCCDAVVMSEAGAARAVRPGGHRDRDGG